MLGTYSSFIAATAVAMDSSWAAGAVGLGFRV